MSNSQEDTFLHKGLRKKLVDEIRSKGILDEQVLEAINKVPRHLFMDSSFVHFAYKDQAFPIAANQTISQPYTVAFQTQLLNISRGDKVLEIGTGSGYQAAVLLEMGAHVFTIERYKELNIGAQRLLPSLGYRPHFFYGDGYEGLPTYAPFDKIIITAAASDLPEKLIEQLRVGGKMVIPLGGKSSQIMTLVEKISETEIESRQHGAFVFVPMLKGKV
jgi:protein-L-isoaspartate(D-aspartate) O-methyltransferase